MKIKNYISTNLNCIYSGITILLNTIYSKFAVIQSFMGVLLDFSLFSLFKTHKNNKELYFDTDY